MATTTQLADFTRAVGGDRVAVTSILKPNDPGRGGRRHHAARRRHPRRRPAFEANLTAYTAELDAAATYLTMMRHSARVIAANLR